MRPEQGSARPSSSLDGEARFSATRFSGSSTTRREWSLTTVLCGSAFSGWSTACWFGLSSRRILMVTGIRGLCTRHTVIRIGVSS